MNLLIILICYIGLVILSLFIYNAYLFNQKMKCAYIVELKNSNPNILVQTKVKVASKKTIRVGTCKIKDNIVEVVLGDKPLDSIKTVFFNNKKNKYYSSRKSSKDVSFDTVLNSEKNIYLYKLKSRNDTFVRETD